MKTLATRNINTNPIKEKEMISEMYERLTDLFGALLVAFVGYFSPLSHVVHIVLLFFLVDIFYGWRAARKLRGEKFQPGIVWGKTMPRVLLSLVLLILSYIIDKETGQIWIDSYRVLGWLICGLLFMSILKNGYIVTNWGAISAIGAWAKKKVKDETGLEINEKNL